MSTQFLVQQGEQLYIDLGINKLNEFLIHRLFSRYCQALGLLEYTNAL